MQHVMIDLETLGTAVNAPVLAIGAVFFEPSTGEIGPKFYAGIDMGDACRWGRPSGDTIKWWFEQKEEARKAAVAGRQSSAEAFDRFRDWLAQGGLDIKPWGNGASFDISILDYAFARITDKPAPWKFWNVRDCRTIQELGRLVTDYSGVRQGTHHHALDDALFQAQWVSHYWQALTKGSAAHAAPPRPVASTSAVDLLV